MIKRKHRCNSNSRADQRKLHKQLRQSHITPLSTLTNGKFAADFAIEYVRSYTAKRHNNYLQKQKKAKEDLLVKEKKISNGKEQSCGDHENDKNSEKTDNDDTKVQKDQTHVICKDVTSQHATGGQKHKRTRLFP